MLKKLLLALGLVGLITAPSRASNAINGVTMKAYRNATSIAVQAVVTGDNDTNAVCRIWTGTAPDSGMLMHRRPGTHVYDGRILWVPENVTVTYFVKAEDGGTPQQTSSDTASCSRYSLPPTNGTQYYVDQALGNDINAGTAPGASAKKTISSAVSKLVTDNAPDGSVINVSIGEYHEVVTLTSNTDGRHYTLLGASRDSTIICGANPNIEAGTRDGTNAIVWTFTGQDSTYRMSLPATGAPGDSTQLIILGFGEYIHRKTSILAVLNDSTGGPPSNCSANPPGGPVGELSGWYWSQDTLYVKRSNGSSPSVSGNHFGYLDNLVTVSKRNWTVQNLTIRYAGGRRTDNLNTDATFKTNALLTGGNLNPGLRGVGVAIGSVGVNASGTSVINCNLYGCNAALVSSGIFAASGRSDSITVAGCTFNDFNLKDMDYTAQKCRAEEGMVAVSALCGHMNIYNNNIISASKGVITSSFQSFTTDSTNASHSEISYNTVQCIDDGIEVDLSAAVNMLVLKNLVKKSVSGFSCIGGYTGPTFVFYNTLYAKNNGTKLGGSGEESYYFYHNTILPDPNISPVIYNAVACVGGFVHNYHYRNNIFGLTTSSSGPSKGPSAGADSAGTSFQNSFNYNGYQVASGGNTAGAWPANRTLTVATLGSTLTWEKNGREIVGNLNLKGQSSYDARLQSTSGAIDGGQRIAGVNTAFGHLRYKTLPDLGVFEYGYPVKLIWLRRRRG